MAIKWKKSHPALSFLCFWMAIHLFVTAIFLAVYSCNLVGYTVGAGNPLSTGPAGVWQLTNRFHSDLSEIMQSVLWEQLDEEYKEELEFSASESGGNLKIAVKRGDTQVINTFSGSVPTSPKDLETGYSYLLLFDGKTTRAFYDGQEQPIDGYRGGWYLPGSGNSYLESTPEYTDTLEELTVTIAIKDVPQIQNNLSYYAEILLYDSYASFTTARMNFKWAVAVLLLALFLFILYILRRKDKAVIDRKISSGLRRVPLLVKLLIGGGIFLLLTTPAVFAGAYLLVWYFYVLYCDLRYNKKEFFSNTCIHRLSLRVSHFQNRLPVQKRLISNSWLALGSVILSSLIFLFLMACFPPYAYPFQVVYFLLLLFWILSEIGIMVFFEKRKFRMADDLRVLLQAIFDVYAGKYENIPEEIPKDFQYVEALKELQGIREGMEKALQKEIEAVESKIKNERMKIDLITNVSHDIRTPLTSIIGYVELLKEEEGLPEHVKEYVHVLDEKSQRLRSMVEDVFDMSKATSGNMKLNMETLDFARLLRQTLADMEDRIEESGFVLRILIPETPLWINSDGAHLYRVLQNLLQNALQYSLEGSKIRIAMKQEDDTAMLIIRNISQEDLPEGADFTERFFRGDVNRSSEGSGLGLSIAKSFTEACGGSFTVETQEDVFTVLIAFPIVSPPEETFLTSASGDEEREILQPEESEVDPK